MKKRKSLLVLSLAFSSLLLASCSFEFVNTFFPTSSSSVDWTVTSVSHNYSLTDGAYYDAPLSSFQDMSFYKHGEYGTLGGGNMPSIGKAKLLVIPVYFTDGSAPSSNELSALNSAFFGEASETGWESLSSYYAKSSYGQLDIEGVVTEAYCYPSNSTLFQLAFEKNAKSTDDVLTSAINWASKEGYIDSSFDANGDGYLDGVDLIYFTDKTTDDNSDLWWAFTTNCSSYEEAANVSSPVPYRYFWAPMSLIANGYYSPDIDTHTLIHETGHMMGLDDYYSYDKTKVSGTERYSEAPCGMVDMMDCNVGDHDAYSKMMLGWVSPKVVLGDGTFSITLNSFTETGDFLLIPSGSWNGTPYDEYMILQYYTPTGLNEGDSNGYKEFASKAYGHGGTYAYSGLQSFHVDSRVVSYDIVYNAATKKHSYSNFGYSEDPLTEEKENADGSYTLNLGIGASNTGSYSIDVEKSRISLGSEGIARDSSNRLITILPANGTTAFLSPKFESNFGAEGLLFVENGNSTYTNEKLRGCYQNGGKFNNGSVFPYTFSVSEQTSSSIKVTFTHL